mmetsp:Transcript_16807/g.24864  ORF Transcript_16807/g.24864 Transcript_16807/m.24864 type:complete len:1152 (+) Transcript_16807:640-4095(+)
MILTTKPFFRTSFRSFLSVFLYLCIFDLCSASTSGTPHLRTPSHNHNRLVQEVGEVGNITITSWIPLFLKLQYLDDSLAKKIETEDHQDEAVATLCDEIHKQAGGNQVKLAAAEAGIIVSTDLETNHCSIQATNRFYDDTAPPGLFTLELEVLQKVLASSSNVTLLTPLIELGFARGRGGRAQLLENLQGTTFFSNLQEVGVLEDRSLSQPNFSPSSNPSLIPSQDPSLVPTTVYPTFNPTEFQSATPTTPVQTFAPTQYPSKIASITPSLSSTTASPTSTPSTLAPSLMPSALPSLKNDPTNAPTVISVSNAPTAMSIEPTSPPSVTTSFSPSSSPSFSPTQVPTAKHFLLEPIHPNLDPPTLPSSVPSFRPSIKLTTTALFPSSSVPSNPTHNTQEPSLQLLPTDPDSSLRSSSQNNDPLVIGVIVGGSITAALCFCFLIGCCWKLRTNQRNDGEDLKLRNMQPTNEASSGYTPILPVVPGVVQLDDDNQSLANTTLGEQTAGRAPPKKKKIVQLDSFDESSLYTSTNSIMPSKEIRDDNKPQSGISQKKLDTKTRDNSTAEGSFESSFFPSDSDTPSRLTEPSVHDFEMNDTTENFFADKEEGLLGAVDQFRPLAAKIEHMVAAELGDTSASSSPSANSTVLGISQPESPFGFSRRQETGDSNIVVVRDADDAGSLQKDMNKNTKTNAAREVESTDSRSSMTSRIGNTTSFTSFSPSSDSSRSSSKSHKQPDAPETYSGRGNSGTFPMSPSALLQSKLSESKINMSPVYRSRGLGFTKSSSFGYTQHFVPRKSPTNSTTSESSYFPPKAPKETPSAHVSTPPKSVPPKNESESFITPTNSSPPEIYSDDIASSQGRNKETFNSPTGHVTGAFPSFRSPASTKTMKQQQRTPITPISPAPSSSDSEDSKNNKFLFGAIEGALGPKSQSADLESLGGRSGRSCSSRGRIKKRGHSEVDSIGSRCSRHSGRLSHITLASEEKSDMSRLTPRAIEHDLHRIEKQLAVLKTEVTKKKKIARKETPTSPLTMSTGDITSYVAQKNFRVSSKQRVVVIVPPGKLGVILANRRDSTGTVVAEVRESSPLAGSLNLGDKLVEVDGVDVTEMLVSDITAMMKATIDKERHLTVITSSKVRSILSPNRSHETLNDVGRS